jgi:hypothetical protein
MMTPERYGAAPEQPQFAPIGWNLCEIEADLTGAARNDF